MSKFLDSNGLQYLWQKIKNAIHQCLITDTASGAIASFPDGAAMPVESLTVEMSPIQNLNGQDAPYPAGGGKNKYGGIDTVLNAYITSSGTISGSADNRAVICSVKPSTTYTVSFTRSAINANDDWQIGEYADMPAVNSTGVCLYSGSMLNTGVTRATVTTGETTSYLAIKIANTTKTDFDNTRATLQVEEGFTATAWSPYSNICPITGRESVTVVRTGVNVWDGEWEEGGLNGTGNKVAGTNRIRTKNYIPVLPDTNYYFVLSDTTFAYYPKFYDKNGVYVGNVSTITASTVRKTPAGAYKMMFYLWKSGWTNFENQPEISINYPSTDHDYHPGNVESATIQLGQTVYGGTLDVTTGVMTVDRAMVTLDGTNAWTMFSEGKFFVNNVTSDAATIVERYVSNQYPFAGFGNTQSNAITIDKRFYGQRAFNRIWVYDSQYTTLDTFKAALSATPLQVVYPLDTPVEITLAPAILSTLKGQNNVWSDADSVTVEYVCDPKLYIARLTEPDADMVADANITSGSYFMVGNNLYLATANIASGAVITPGVNCTRTNLASALNAINS